MKLNADKCHLLVGRYKHESIWAKIGDARIWESNKQKLLGYIQIEHYPLTSTFQIYVKKTGRTFFVLATLSSYVTLTQRRFLTISFIEAQFGYCPLLSIGCFMNRNINHLHEHSVRIVYRDTISSFHEGIQKDYFFKIHHRNIQSLAIELCKIKEKLSSIFPHRLIKCNLRTQYDFFRNSVNTCKDDLNSIRLFASIRVNPIQDKGEEQ